ncbi:MAG: GIY-YIG nuclease family protein [Lacunisphaera sp.]
MNGFSYVYILEGLSAAGGYYVGMTDDIANRLAKHNEGGVPHTTRLRPWRVKTAIAFRDRIKAAAFEKYLKSPSGRAFAKKRL